MHHRRHARPGERPRNVDWRRAAALLYGDWGTSKAYIIGLAFAVAGYSSPWLIAMMAGVMILVAYNYLTICRLYPFGGGVYASLRDRSESLSSVGAFLLIADYLVTAAISALSAFYYLGVSHPVEYAFVAILVIGAINFLGPKESAGVAILISVPTAIVVLLLGCFALPHFREAEHMIQPLHGGFFNNWQNLVAIMLALSGIEAVANSTGVMRLDPHTSHKKPVVIGTSTPAILLITAEVCVMTTVLGFAMAALPGLVVHNGEVDAPGATGVRDYLLRYMGKVFVGNVLGSHAGEIASTVISILFGLLLLSAVNTAMVALSSLTHLMARDWELPRFFYKLNRHGVPIAGLLLSIIIPALLVMGLEDIAKLADLYAVGVVGAITLNLGATSTDPSREMKVHARIIMFLTFLLMASVEITLLVLKPNARWFALAVVVIGLLMRWLAKRGRKVFTND
jgi:amino acid transporter